jgi:hypothetical protein
MWLPDRLFFVSFVPSWFPYFSFVIGHWGLDIGHSPYQYFSKCTFPGDFGSSALNPIPSRTSTAPRGVG